MNPNNDPFNDPNVDSAEFETGSVFESETEEDFLKEQREQNLIAKLMEEPVEIPVEGMAWTPFEGHYAIKIHPEKHLAKGKDALANEIYWMLKDAWDKGKELQPYAPEFEVKDELLDITIEPFKTEDSIGIVMQNTVTGKSMTFQYLPNAERHSKDRVTTCNYPGETSMWVGLRPLALIGEKLREQEIKSLYKDDPVQKRNFLTELYSVQSTALFAEIEKDIQDSKKNSDID
jgi:hypothetical protein